MTWLVTLDVGRCTGSGVCAALASGHFAYREGRSVPPEGPVDPDDDVLAAAECCPMEAISVTDLATGRVLHP
ncbi:ferredoxin [Micromonospora sp. DT31]|uniref:ferredoxin n=1 Tax=Micromonospora sp. DT31 TaxID=3393434 RepID=UPI003CF9AFD7